MSVQSTKGVSSKAEIVERLEFATPHILLMVLAGLTGDRDLLKTEWRPDVMDEAGGFGLSDEQQAEIRALCADRLAGYIDGTQADPGRPNYDRMRSILEWMVGPEADTVTRAASEEMVFDGDDLKTPRWSKADVAPQRDFHVAIIGAGEAGLIAAYRLKQAGVPFVIYEKNPGVGGTWYENDYPGCRVDITSFVYSYACRNTGWKEHYAQSGEMKEYFDRSAEDFGVTDNIVFNSEVRQCVWNEADSTWDLEIDGPDGVRLEKVQMLVSAVGQLNRPMIPTFEGQDSFTGPKFHSTQWPHDIDFTGKKVTVIGTGASAIQFIPKVAEQCAELTIIMRTVPWLVPTLNQQEAVDDAMNWLLENVPHYAVWNRIWLWLPQFLGLLDFARVDPDFPPTEESISVKNKMFGDMIKGWLESQITERPDLKAAVMPTHPVFAKRSMRDNGTWLRTLKRDNVKVVLEPIRQFTSQGVETESQMIDSDVIIYGTGFRATDFLFPMSVKGQAGEDLQDFWKGTPAAYVGMTVPKFPNMFIMYGPNTALLAHGGSAIYFSECEAAYITQSARFMLEEKLASMDVKHDAYQDYNDRVQRESRQLAWGWSSVNNWYKNKAGKVTQAYPLSSIEFWQRTREVQAQDYNLTKLKS